MSKKEIGRGTTPTHKLLTNRDLSGCRVFVTYKQNGIVVVEKTNEELTITEDSVVVDLSQEETLRFDTQGDVRIQVRYITKSGKAYKSGWTYAKVTDVDKEGVIEWQ